jgi:acetyl-CoA carboxylase biotin carboxyl carrier protein
MTRTPDNKTIRELAKILNDSNLSEIEIEMDDVRIRVAREISAVTVSAAAPQTTTLVAPAAAAPSLAEPAPAAANNPDAVKSPMVGTVYLASEPGAKNFANVGDSVKVGDTLFIVEAMKTMNPITAPKAGKVTSVLVDNGQPIEFDEVLAIIE